MESMGRKQPRPCCTSLVTMFCPDCMQNLDDLPTGDPCPQCGGRRRSAQVFATAALVAVSAAPIPRRYHLPGYTLVVTP